MLVEEGTDSEATALNNDRETPLHLVVLLLNSGADITIVN